MPNAADFRWFQTRACRLCGRCIEACPVLNLSGPAAAADKRRLLSDKPEKSLALRFCTTCNVCDFACPQQADPYALILECFDRRGAEKGLPYIAKMVFPNEPENIWSAVRPFMARSERTALEQWAENLETRHTAIILTGFYTNLVPFLAEIGVVQSLGLPIAGSEGLWGCGGDTHKLGNIGLTQAAADLAVRALDRMGVQRIYCFMQAEAAMLAEILPRYYGISVNAEVSWLDELILEKIRSGGIHLHNRLNLTVTVHDNCMSRYSNGRPQKTLRAILAETGCKMVEMPHNRFQGLCCGWAATIPTLYAENAGNPLKTVAYLIYSLHRRLTEAESTGADALVTGCPACFLFLTLIKTVSHSRIAVYHVLEVVDMAAGGKRGTIAEDRCWEILAHTTTIIFNWFLLKGNRRPFFPRPIDTTCLRPPHPQSEAMAAVNRKLVRVFKSRLVQNPVSRRVLALLVTVTTRGYQLWFDRQKQS